MERRSFIKIAAQLAALGSLPQSVRAASLVTVHHSPGCGCCEAWAKHLQAAGFSVSMHEADDLAPIRRRLRVPTALAGCHSGEIGGYSIEGHVPARDIRRVLDERPAARGLAVPGMPAGSPGMETGGPADRYDVILFADDGGRRIYARY